MIRPAVILLLSLAVGACQDDPTSTEPEVGEDIHVEVGEHVTFRDEGFTVRFIEVVGDSRCPIGVTCVWAGNARIRVAVEPLVRGAADHVFELNTYLDPKQASFAPYSIRLVSLYPYPHVNVERRNESYVATLRVTRGGASD